MKTFIIGLLMILTASCANKKEAIVTRQIKLKKDIQSLGYELDKQVGRMAPLDSLEAISIKRVKAQNEYDSLDMELKKY